VAGIWLAWFLIKKKFWKGDSANFLAAIANFSGNDVLRVDHGRK